MNWIREDLRDLKEYKENTSPYKIKLDANEGANLFLQDLSNIDMNFLKDINRYPDSSAESLRVEIGEYTGVNVENIIAGNGSSEMIELIMKTFIEKGDKILSFVPTFSMYSIFSKIYGAEFIETSGQVPCSNKENQSYQYAARDNFSLDMDVLIEKMKEVDPKIILLCNPNNPSGYLISKDEIKKLLENTNSLVVVDEAYIEFAEGSMVDEIDKYRNLIVLRTLSKALGLAGIRLGYMVSNIDIINWINKVKAPYSLNSLTQAFGIAAIKNKDLILKYVEQVKMRREKLYSQLIELGVKTYPSKTNFILFYSDIADLSEKLQFKGILIRAFSEDLEGYYRVTVGDEYENNEFIKSLKEILEYEKI